MDRNKNELLFLSRSVTELDCGTGSLMTSAMGETGTWRQEIRDHSFGTKQLILN